jgi:salicylate hydroxylase
LGHEHPPEETGALAYRGIFSLKELKALNDPQVDDLLKADKVQNWLGPGKHCVFYPLRNHTEYNIVLM